MRIGVFVMGSRGGSFDAVLAQAQRIDELGFHSVVVGERHFRHEGLLYASPLAAAAAIAARTSRVRIGLAGRILPLDHPLHIAEGAATLDVLSGGRLDFGVTRASLDDEAHAVFGSPKDEATERFEEALEVIVKAWTRDCFSHDGRHWSIPEVSVSPKPVQRPLPPIYVVAVSPDRLDFAARGGYPAYIGATRPIGELAEAARHYWATGERNGYDGRLDLSINRFVYVAESDERARADLEEPFIEFIDEHAPDLRAALIAKYGGRENLTFDRCVEDFLLVGSPATVASRIRTIGDEVACSYLLATFNFVTVDHPLCVRSMELFAAEVMPRLAC
jgi:alkanesulfonate monooxygenase SsuD/methylene tetrahydromethanopterin reductase-like flavin-dependent oxidoreductase (luciferase family)